MTSSHCFSKYCRVRQTKNPPIETATMARTPAVANPTRATWKYVSPTACTAWFLSLSFGGPFSVFFFFISPKAIFLYGAARWVRYARGAVLVVAACCWGRVLDVVCSRVTHTHQATSRSRLQDPFRLTPSASVVVMAGIDLVMQRFPSVLHHSAA